VSGFCWQVQPELAPALFFRNNRHDGAESLRT
jgi:hypothetical protein